MSNNNVEFHVEPTNICTLKCPGCERTRFIDQWGKHWQNHSIDVDDLMNFLDLDLENITVMLCGNTGDPIYHKDLHHLVYSLKQRGAVVKLITNGSYKSAEWWTKLCSMLDHNDCITFSIDGLPTNFTEYRINGDWDSIKVGIDVAVASACQTTWKYIPFRYNQNNINEARELSKQFGMDHFELSSSDRFDEKTNHYKPSDDLLGSRYESQIIWKNRQSSISVDPECKSNKMHYISAQGYYLPCCYIGDYRFYYKTDLWKSKEQYNIKTTRFSQIINSDNFNSFIKGVQHQPACQFNCPTTNEKSNNTN